MTIDDSQIRDLLRNGLDSLQVPGGIPEPLLRRAKRRRIATSFATGVLATTLFAGAVYGATTLTNNRRADIPPAQSARICSPEEVDIFTDVSDPVGTGAGHYGVYFEVRITPHDMSCEPTLYIELDDSPVLPPDHEGPDADEFRYADENPCRRAVRAAGDFLYSGKHTIDVGTGCDPDDPSPHKTQESIRFDGKTHERIGRGDSQCPDLLPPGRRARELLRPAVNAYLNARQPDGTESYKYRVKRLSGPILGGPEGECSTQTWQRSFQVEGQFKYPATATNPSASLSYFRVVVGRAENGWIVWAEPH